VRVLKWAAVVTASVALGAGLVGYLVAPPLEMALALLLVASVAVALVLLVVFALDGRERPAGVGLLLVEATAGHLGATSPFHSLYDIPEAVTNAGVPSDVEIVNLGAWDDDPFVIRAIKERVDACRTASR
jgi:hypothetical protein